MKVKHQAGALLYKFSEDRHLEILLITSQGSENWSIPKGNIEPGEELFKAASREALEEAGAEDEISFQRLATYFHKKRAYTSIVSVFPMRVTKMLKYWDEHKMKKRKWHCQLKAAEIVANPELSRIIQNFKPS